MLRDDPTVIDTSQASWEHNHRKFTIPYPKSRSAILRALHDDIMAKTFFRIHYDDVIMTMLASQITSLTVVYSIVYSGVIQRKHQSSASLAFVREIHRGPVNFPHKWPVTRKMFPFDDVIMSVSLCWGFTGGFHSQRVRYGECYVLSTANLNELLHNQSSCWRFETTWRPCHFIGILPGTGSLYHYLLGTRQSINQSKTA